jgi:hypothetical protein
VAISLHLSSEMQDGLDRELIYASLHNVRSAFPLQIDVNAGRQAISVVCRLFSCDVNPFFWWLSVGCSSNECQRNDLVLGVVDLLTRLWVI